MQRETWTLFSVKSVTQQHLYRSTLDAMMGSGSKHQASVSWKRLDRLCMCFLSFSSFVSAEQAPKVHS